jgi:hypothetical protein
MHANRSDDLEYRPLLPPAAADPDRAQAPSQVTDA